MSEIINRYEAKTIYTCNYCGKPITDEFPDNYYVSMTMQDGWWIHALCWPAWLHDAIKEDDDFDFKVFLGGHSNKSTGPVKTKRHS